MSPELTARERIVAAARAGLERGGRPAVAEIVARAGVSRATFYRTFASREQLFAELEAEPEPDRRQAVLEAAAELVARDGLARLSMDELATRAGVSRAWLYRAYPGKSALFTALVLAFSPIEVIAETMERLKGLPPEEALPELAATAWRTLAGRVGVVRPLLFEVTALSPDVRETVLAEAAPRLLGSLGAYLVTQMEEGRMRHMHPILALQAFIGPIIVHVLMRPVLAELLGVELDSEAAVREFAANYVRGMRP